MRFGILGPTRVQLADGEDIPVGGPRVRALLARLLLDAGQVVGPEMLIDSLYGDDPPAGAANALQSHVSRLRHALHGGSAGTDGADAGDTRADSARSMIEFSPAGYRLAVDPDAVDAHRFARLTAAGRLALADGDHQRAATMLREALALWRGSALADVAQAPFAAPQATRLEELRLAALEDRVEAELALGGQGTLIAELRYLVTDHPLRERLRAQLMRALYASGRAGEALTAYEEGRRILAEELGIEPSAELAATHLAILRGEPPPGQADDVVRGRQHRPRPPAPGGPGGSLPAQLTSFVGRAAELARVGTLLGEARLVTLTGPGGAGKTRLSIEAAARWSGEVCLVELAPISGAGTGQADTAEHRASEQPVRRSPVRRSPVRRSPVRWRSARTE